MAIVEVSIVPIGTGNPSVSGQVAMAVGVLAKQKDVKYQVTPMGTVMEGDLDKIFSLVKQMQDVLLSDNVQRVHTTIVIDERRDKKSTMEGKVRAVQEKLGKK